MPQTTLVRNCGSKYLGKAVSLPSGWMIRKPVGPLATLSIRIFLLFRRFRFHHRPAGKEIDPWFLHGVFHSDGEGLFLREIIQSGCTKRQSLMHRDPQKKMMIPATKPPSKILAIACSPQSTDGSQPWFYHVMVRRVTRYSVQSHPIVNKGFGRVSSSTFEPGNAPAFADRPACAGRAECDGMEAFRTELGPAFAAIG